MKINTATNDLLKHNGKYYLLRRLKEFLSIDKKIDFEIGVKHSGEIILVYKTKTANGTARFLPIDAVELANKEILVLCGTKNVWNTKLKIYKEKNVYKKVKNVYEF